MLYLMHSIYGQLRRIAKMISNSVNFRSKIVFLCGFLPGMGDTLQHFYESQFEASE